MSAWKASAVRSKCSLMWSSNCSGMPGGNPNTGHVARRFRGQLEAALDLANLVGVLVDGSADRSRRGPSRRPAQLAERANRECSGSGACARARTSGVAPLPNSRSNTTCGLSSIGSGLVRGDGLDFAGRRQPDPRDRIRVRAAVAFAAVAGARVRILDGELQRRQQRSPDRSSARSADRSSRCRPWRRIPRSSAA